MTASCAWRARSRISTAHPASLAQQIHDLAANAFVDGLQLACLVAMAIVLAAAVMVFIYLPARAEDAREAVSGPLDGLASSAFAEAEAVLEADTAAEAEAEVVGAGRTDDREDREAPVGR